MEHLHLGEYATCGDRACSHLQIDGLGLCPNVITEKHYCVYRDCLV